MTAAIQIATSIAPGPRLDVQIEAIASWHRHEFRVVSYNEAAEAAPLREAFPDVEFRDAGRTARAQIGKPLVYVSDIVQSLAATSDGVCGLVNSDIFFPEVAGLGAFIEREGAGALILGARLEVGAFNDATGTPDPFGFDYFFFPAAAAQQIPSANFMLGMPLWDYWFPLQLINQGVAAKKLKPPLGRHVSHEGNWAENIFAFGNMFVDYLVEAMQRQTGNQGWGAAGASFICHHHARLRDAAQQSQTAGDGDAQYQRMAQLAEFYDSLSQFAFRAIVEQSTPLRWQAAD